MRPRGFTLMEVVVALFLAAMLLVLVFALESRVRETRVRVDARVAGEFRLYRTLDALGEVVAAMSALNPESPQGGFPLFRGTPEEAVFITRTPLLAAVPGPHRVTLHWEKNRLLLREERVVLAKEKGGGLSAGEWTELTPPMAKGRFAFRVWNPRRGEYRWVNELDCSAGVPLPLAVRLEFQRQDRLCRVVMTRRLTDGDEGTEAMRLP